jgi:hypothetical protein
VDGPRVERRFGGGVGNAQSVVRLA